MLLFASVPAPVLFPSGPTQPRAVVHDTTGSKDPEGPGDTRASAAESKSLKSSSTKQLLI